MPAVAIPELRRFVTDVLIAVKTPPDVAAIVCESLVGADLAGHASHGVMKLPSYVRDIHQGKLHPTARPQVVTDSLTTAVVDGGASFGHLAARFAVDLAVAKARVCGLSAVSVSHAHHTGRLGGWSERIAAADLIGMLMGGEGQGPYKVTPHGGRSGALATNPVTWAIPAGPGRPPVLLDYATSVVSLGKVQIAKAENQPVPDHWIVDARAQPSTRPDDFIDGGFLLPFGGYKGYALAVIAELLAVGLSAGDRFGGNERSSCLFVLAIDPEKFRPLAGLHEFVQSTSDRLRSVPASTPGGEVLVPGEPEVRARAGAVQVRFPEPTWASLHRTATALGVAAMPVLR